MKLSTVKTMAKQDPNPPPWTDDMGDGCTGVCDYGYTDACNKHDAAYHYGGNEVDKQYADDEFYNDMCNTPGFWGWYARLWVARRRYIGVRATTYNFPPGHPNREEGHYIEAFNWLGKPHASL